LYNGVICGLHFSLKILRTLHETLFYGKHASETYVTGNVLNVLVRQPLLTNLLEKIEENMAG